MPVEGLQPPDKAETADPSRSTEVLRLWFIEGAPHAVMWPAFEKPEWFGVVLSDVIRQMAKVYEAAGLMQEGPALEEIKAGLQRALESSNYAPGGGFRPDGVTVQPTPETKA